MFISDWCFRLDSNQTGVVFEDDVDHTTTTQIPEFGFPDVITIKSAFEKHNVTVANRTKMIVANEILNLPRFDPKNSKNKQSLNWEIASSTELPPPMPDLADPDDVTNLRNESLGQANFYGDLCQFCPDARFMQHYFAKGCIAMELQIECQPKFCPKYFDCPKEKELPKDGLSLVSLFA